MNKIRLWEAGGILLFSIISAFIFSNILGADVKPKGYFYLASGGGSWGQHYSQNYEGGASTIAFPISLVDCGLFFANSWGIGIRGLEETIIPFENVEISYLAILAPSILRKINIYRNSFGYLRLEVMPYVVMWSSALSFSYVPFPPWPLDIRLQIGGFTDEASSSCEISGSIKLGLGRWWMHEEKPHVIPSIAEKLDIEKPVAKPPRLSFDYFIEDENRDKIFDGGEKVGLKVRVKNTGKGKAEGVVVKLAGQSKAINYLGRAKNIGDIEPYGEKEAIFECTLPNTVEREDASLVISVTEAKGFNALEETELIIAMKPAQVRRKTEVISELINVDVNIPKTNINNPDAVAVVIGVKDYKKPDVPKVEYAINDALIVKKYLIQTFGFREGNIIFLENPTLSDLITVFGSEKEYKGQLYNYVKSGKSDVFIYYAGHGTPDVKTKKAYLVPSDCDPQYVKLNGYPLATFYNNLRKIPARRFTVVIDACFSGASEGGMLIASASPLAIATPEEVAELSKNMVVITSSTGDQISSWYHEKRHSLFTYYFLKATGRDGDANGDSQITLGEMEKYINENVLYYARRKYGREQIPQFRGAKDRVIVKY